MSGTLRERSKGVYELRVSAGKDPRTQRYRTVTRTFHGNKSDAKKALADFASEVNKGLHNGTAATVGELLDRWYVHLEYLGRSPNTLYGYRGRIDRDIKPAVGHLSLRKVKTADLDRAYATWSTRLAPASVRQNHAILHRAFAQAMRWGWMSSNPAALA